MTNELKTLADQQASIIERLELLEAFREELGNELRQMALQSRSAATSSADSLLEVQRIKAEAAGLLEELDKQINSGLTEFSKRLESDLKRLESAPKKSWLKENIGLILAFVWTCLWVAGLALQCLLVFKGA